jgi:hypothetical protein
MSPFSRGTLTGGSRADPAPKASGAFREGDPNSLWGRSLEKQSRAVRRAQEMARSGAREIGQNAEHEIRADAERGQTGTDLRVHTILVIRSRRNLFSPGMRSAVTARSGRLRSVNQIAVASEKLNVTPYFTSLMQPTASTAYLSRSVKSLATMMPRTRLSPASSLFTQEI